MLKTFIAQFEKKDKEGSLRQKSLEENIFSLTMEIESTKKALFERENDLQRAVGGFNEKGEELDLLTAQVIIYYYIHFNN